MAGVLLQDSLLVLMILGFSGEAASVASVHGLQAGAAGSRPSGAAGASRAGWCREESGGPTKEHALIARRDVSPSHGAHQARSGVSIGGSSLRHRLHLPLQGQIPDSSSPNTNCPYLLGESKRRLLRAERRGTKEAWLSAASSDWAAR